MFPNYGFVEGKNHTKNAVLQIWREEMQQVYLGKAIIPEVVDK